MMDTVDIQQVEELVGLCRRLGINHFKFDKMEFHLTDKAPTQVQTKSPVDTQVKLNPSIPNACQCGHPPWVCTGRAPCLKGCSSRQCHPIPKPQKD